MYVTEN